MSKKRILILIIIVAVVVIGLIFVFIKKPAGEENKGILSRFFPAGEKEEITSRPLATTTAPGQTPEDLQTQKQEAELLKLTQEAIAGATFANGKVRYIERATGHLYEIGPSGEEKNRISNTTIPRILEAVWSKNASSSVIRILDETGENLRNFAAAFTGSSTQGVFLPFNITSITASPAENKIFYLLKNSGQTSGIQTDFENKNRKELINVPFGEFLADWPEKNSITLLSKPSNLAEGFLFKLDLKTLSLTKILGNIKGLFAKMSPDGKKIIYSQSAGNQNLETSILILDNSQKIPLGIATLAEKCVFANGSANVAYCAAPRFIPNAALPDAWYQGIISFSDDFWQIDAESGILKILAGGAEDIDAINLFLDPEDKFLFFTNKKDNALWRLQLATGD